MQQVDLADLPVFGELDRDRTADGVRYRRAPAWAIPQIVDPWHLATVSMPAGVRLEFTTASRVLELDVRPTSFGYIEADTPITTPVFDLVVGGALAASRVVEHGEIERSDLNDKVRAFTSVASTVRFDLPGDPSVPVEVWLPHTAVVELLGVRIDDGTSLVAAAGTRSRWVHYGSSISHCMASPTPTDTWPAIVALRAGLDVVDLGVSGNCQLDAHVGRAIRDTPADFISIKCGINVLNADTMRERAFVPALHGFLDTVRDGHPTTPIVVATPIICPIAEDHPGPTLVNEDGTIRVVPRDEDLATGALSLGRIRELIASIVEVRQKVDPNLHLMDGRDLFSESDLADLPDGLHPNAEGYRRIADRFHALTFENGPFATG